MLKPFKIFLGLSCSLFFFLSSAHTQSDSVKMFIFGHSLLDHRPPIIATPSDETTVPHWLQLLREDAGDYYAATGQYGFLPQHANLPPFAQWGYDIVNPVWDSDLIPFAEANFNTAVITAGNFIQWQGPDEPYYGGNGETPISATEDIIDWLDIQESGIDIYLYENWPDMATFIAGELFPPSAAEFDNYNNYTLGDFHDWWIDYQDALIVSRPDLNVRMIPVGPILAQLFGSNLLNQIPITELYEDNAPHGRATTYFLASLITHMAISQERADDTYDVPNIIHPLVEANYTAVVDFIWGALNSFVDNNGNSRVFPLLSPAPVSLSDFKLNQKEAGIELHWTTASELNNARFEVQYAKNGIDFKTIGTLAGNDSAIGPFDYNFLHRDYQTGSNYYRLKQIDWDGQFEYSDILSIEILSAKNTFALTPNPSFSDDLNLYVLATNQEDIEITAFDLTGRMLFKTTKVPKLGKNNFALNFNFTSDGLFLINIRQGSYSQNDLLMIQQ